MFLAFGSLKCVFYIIGVSQRVRCCSGLVSGSVLVSRDGRIDPKVSILSILVLYRKDRSSYKNIDSKVHFFNY